VITVLQDLFDTLNFFGYILLLRLLYYIYLRAFRGENTDVERTRGLSQLSGRVTAVTPRVTGQAVIGNCAPPLTGLMVGAAFILF